MAGPLRTACRLAAKPQRRTPNPPPLVHDKCSDRTGALIGQGPIRGLTVRLLKPAFQDAWCRRLPSRQDGVARARRG